MAFHAIPYVSVNGLCFAPLPFQESKARSTSTKNHHRIIIYTSNMSLICRKMQICSLMHTLTHIVNVNRGIRSSFCRFCEVLSEETITKLNHRDSRHGFHGGTNNLARPFHDCPQLYPSYLPCCQLWTSRRLRRLQAQLDVRNVLQRRLLTPPELQVAQDDSSLKPSHVMNKSFAWESADPGECVRHC